MSDNTPPAETRPLGLHPTPQDPPSRMQDGSMLGRYRLIELIGSGGMGEVYRAQDPVLNRDVAIKLIKWDDPLFMQRFVQEAQAQARVEHENVCQIYEAVTGDPGTRPYIVMQYVRGKTLKDAAEGMTLEQKVRVLRDVAGALHAAHKLGLIHRDVKPSNILVEVDEEGQLKPYITDFGLAKEVRASSMSMTGMLIGTLHYMSPEQARGEVHRLDRRTDVYALGCTLYELLTNRPVIETQNTMEILTSILEDDPRPPHELNPDIPEDLETIVLKAMEKDPLRRYSSARAMADDLDRYLSGDPVLAHRATWWQMAARKIRKHRTVAAVTVLAAVVVLIVTGWALHARWQASEKARLAGLFGQELERAEATLREAYLLPLHDTRRERQIVEQKIEWIRKEMSSVGRNSYGPGFYAIARACFALGNYRDAQVYLEKAWSEENYREPETAYALGLTLAVRYKEELSAVNQTYAKEERQKKKEELDALYKNPAIEFLKLGQHSRDEAVEYAQAQLSFLSGHEEEALKLAAIAAKKFPWRYEAEELQGDIYGSMGERMGSAGKLQPAMELYGKAEAAYRAAVRKGESDGALYEAMCRTANNEMWTQAYLTGASLDAEYRKGMEACEAALTANPDSKQAHVQRAVLIARWIQYRTDNGENTEADLPEAIRAGAQAVRIAGDIAQAHNALGLIYMYQAEFQAAHGEGADAAYNRARQCFVKAISIHPASSVYYGNKGNAEVGLVESQISRGENPEAILRETIASFRESIRLNPKRPASYANLGIAYWDLAEEMTHQGKNPQQSLDEAKKSYEEALKINPKLIPALNNMAGVLNQEARYLLYTGKSPDAVAGKALEFLNRTLAADPENPFALYYSSAALAAMAEFRIRSGESADDLLHQSVALAEKALSLAPENAEARMQAAMALHLLAQDKLLQQQSPAAPLKQAFDYFEEAMKIDADDSNQRRMFGFAYLTGARWNVRSGQPAIDSLTAARSSFEDADRLKPNSVLNQEGLGMSLRDQVEWMFQQKQKPEDIAPVIQQALACAERMLTANPTDPHGLALKGRLLQLQSRIAEAPQEETALKQKGADLLSAALTADPLLRTDYR